MLKKQSLKVFMIAIILCLSLLSTAPPVLADGGYVQIIDVRLNLCDGSIDTVRLYDNGWLISDRTARFNPEHGVRVAIYAAYNAGGGPPFYYQLRNDVGYDQTATDSNAYHYFYPLPPIAADYMAFVDGNNPGEFYLRELDCGTPDLIASAPSPDNGASSPPFCVGQMIDWYTTVTNQGDGEAADTSVGYYIGTSSSDFSNRVSSDGTGILAPGGSSVEYEAYTFTDADVGTRYTNVWADYANTLEEENENNNTNSYGPFQVIGIPSAPSLSSPSNGSSTCDTSPTFSWGSVSGATSYRIQVDNSSDFSSPEINQTTSNTSYTPGSALTSGTYYWRVQASNSCGTGSWSSTWSFTILTAPSSAPSLSSPSNGSSTCDTTPTFSWGSVSGATSYRLQVDNNSSFSSTEINQTTSSTSYTPGTPLSPGTYYWRVQASNACGDGSWSSTWSVTILSAPGTPSLSSPSNGSTVNDDTPTFSWGSVSGATSYHIQVDNNSSFSSPEIDTTTSNTSYTPGTPLANGTYYWRVQASNACGAGSWSVVWQFTIETICLTPPAPSLSSPSNGSSTCDTSPTFSWGNVSGATSYRIQVDNNSSFSSPEINQTTSSTSYTPGSALAPDTYYWHVQASNACGSSSWSSTWSVTILSTPGTPGLSSPSNGSTVNDDTQTFSWESVSGATSYRLQVDNNSNFSSPEINQTTSSTSYTPGTPLADGTYYWRVQASNACGAGSWSAVWQFTIETICPTPPAPSLSSPSNGSSTCDTTPTLSWGSVGGATSYRIQVDNNSNFSSPEINQTTSSTSYTPGTALAPDTYYWHVWASNACGDGPWSSPWNVTILSAPSTPFLSSPSNGSSTCDTTPTFRWGSVSGAASYRIQLDNNSDFSSPEINRTTSSTSYTPSSTLPPGTYYWHVRASNDCGNSSWSSSRNVTILFPPGTPSLSSPSNGSIVNDDTPTFNWGSVSGTTSYRIQVDNNSSFSSPEINQTTTSTSYTPGTALAADTYYWRVQASNDCGDGSWSSPVWDFTVQPDTTPSLVYDGPGVLSRGGSYMVDEEDQRITMGDHVHLRLPFRNAGSQPISNATVEVLGEQSADKNKYLGITVHDGSDGSTYQHQAIIHLTPSAIDPGKIGFADFWIYVSNPRSRSSLSGGGSLQLQYSRGESRVLVWAEEISFDTRGNETLKSDSCLHTPDNFAIQRYAQFASGARWGEGDFGSNNNDPDTVEQAVRNLLWRVASDFVHDTDSNEPRVPDTTLLTRLGRPTGACRHFADLTAGLLRSLGLPARVTKAAFKKYLVVGVGHNWVEVYLEADNRWVQADSYWTTLATAVFDEPGTYEDEGWTVSKAWADKYPLSSAASQYAEEYLCTPTCYNTPVDCPICIRDSEVIRLPSLWPNLSCVEDVKSSYHNVGLAQAAIATDSDEQLWIQLLNPTFVTLLEPFDLTASIVNSTIVPLDAITATVATKAYVDSAAPLFEVSPPYQVVTNLNSGEAVNVTWVVTPLITGSNIPLRVAAEGGGFFEVAEQSLVVNEPGTLPDLTLGGMCGLDTALPGGAITLHGYVLDESLQPLTDTATSISATVYATPTLLFSTTVNLPWCEACGMYQGVVNLPDTAPIGSYQVDFVATRSGYEADEATGFFFVTPPLDVSLTTNHDRLDMQDTLTLTAQVSDRGTAITDASVWAEIDTPGGVITAPLAVENGSTYMLAFRPVDLAVDFNGSVSPGTWLIRATADYQGSEVTVQKTVVVQGPLYLPIVLKLYVTP